MSRSLVEGRWNDTYGCEGHQVPGTPVLVPTTPHSILGMYHANGIVSGGIDATWYGMVLCTHYRYVIPLVGSSLALALPPASPYLLLI